MIDNPSIELLREYFPQEENDRIIRSIKNVCFWAETSNFIPLQCVKVWVDSLDRYLYLHFFQKNWNDGYTIDRKAYRQTSGLVLRDLLLQCLSEKTTFIHEHSPEDAVQKFKIPLSFRVITD